MKNQIAYGKRINGVNCLVIKGKPWPIRFVAFMMVELKKVVEINA